MNLRQRTVFKLNHLVVYRNLTVFKQSANRGKMTDQERSGESAPIRRRREQRATYVYPKYWQVSKSIGYDAPKRVVIDDSHEAVQPVISLFLSAARPRFRDIEVLCVQSVQNQRLYAR